MTDGGASIFCAADHQINQEHVLNYERYNGYDLIWRGASWPLDCDPMTINQGVLIMLTCGLNRGRPSRSDVHDLIKTVHDGPFHRNRRSF